MSSRRNDTHGAPDDVGDGFRWSWDEIKSVFKRPFSREQGENGEGTRTSLFRFSKENNFRWSLEDFKQKIWSFGSSNGEQPDGGKRKRTKLTKEERERRREDRLRARKEKKSKREKERRENVNGLFDNLGNKLGISPESKKGARLSILSAAVDELRKQKGLDPKGGEDNFDSDVMDLDMDDLLDTPASPKPSSSSKGKRKKK